MMKYYLDTEFLEGTQDIRMFNFTQAQFLKACLAIILIPLVIYGADISYWLLVPVSIIYAVGCYFIDRFNHKTGPTIDLISIGIVSEDGREFYEVSKEFNLKEAWNRYQLKQVSGDLRNVYPEGQKEYWIRENVLRPIFRDFSKLEEEYLEKQERILGYALPQNFAFTKRNFQRLLNKYGKTNKEIAKEVKEFTYTGYWFTKPEEINSNYPSNALTEFYTYYGAYDWVVFCWLFGKMIDLPKGIPMFSIDLKVMLDDKVLEMMNNPRYPFRVDATKEKGIEFVKSMYDYPDNDNLHNALDDAKWNKALHEFILSK